MRDDREEDSPLAGIDLAAWEPPAVPGGIADAVVVRLREPAPVGAIEGDRPARRGLVVAGVGAGVAAVIAIAAWGLVRAPRDAHGDVIATRPQRLELDGSSADLDAGAEVHWRREGRRITATQPRGTARWTVGADDQLVIDAGATVASVEATGASLRVEVEMNLSDARMLGASAVTAAAVAMVTVVVYDGHIKATSGGHAVDVAAGGVIDLRPGQPPHEPTLVGGAHDDLEQLKAQLTVEMERVKQLEAKVAGRVDPDAKAPLIMECAADETSRRWQALETCAEKLLALGAATEGNRYAATARHEQAAAIALAELDAAVAHGDEQRASAAFAKIPEASVYAEQARKRIESIMRAPKSTLGADDIERMADAARPQLLGCNTARFHGNLVATIDVAPKGPIQDAEITGGDAPLQTCVRNVLLAQRLKATAAGGKFRFSITLDDSTSPPEPCTRADDWISEASSQYSSGYAKAALGLMKKALACKSDVRMLRLAATYACRGHDRQAAKVYYDQLPAQFQASIAMACTQEGIDLEH